MQRRKILKTMGAAGTAVVAGCLSGSPKTEGDDSNLIEASPEALLPSARLLGDGWEQESKSSDGDTAEASFSNDDEQEIIGYWLTIYDSVTEAQSAYQEQREQDFAAGEAEPGWSAEELQIASNSHISETSLPIVWFRDANVVAELSHTTYTGGGNASKAEQHAADWHETWRE